MKDAVCAGTAPNMRADPDAFDPFFPERGESTQPGKEMCISCTVRKECLSYRDRTGSREGMWGAVIQKKDDK